MEKAILYFTHNSLPIEMEEFFQKQLIQESKGIPIVAVLKNPRSEFSKTFADLNIVTPANTKSAILNQIKIGIDEILKINKDCIVYLAEHDVLYPSSYFDNTPANNTTFLKNFNLYFANKVGYIGPFNSYIHSQTIGSVELFDKCLKEDVHNHQKFKTKNGYTLQTFSSSDPSIDVRHGLNVSGYRESKNYVYNLPYWGTHEELISKIPKFPIK